jgi:phosphatidylinositol-3,4,5-trisphosphate 3-phosphatase/dual-specificity protein phosphatase PTEN
MRNLLRGLVALPMQLHYDRTLDLYLDLSYIEERLIVCAGPVGDGHRAAYRTPAKDLLRFLRHNHADAWHIWNFRGECQGYSARVFFDKVTWMPFPDHHPPPLKLIDAAVNALDRFLRASTANVAVLHCKAGKGRLGTICCAYLMWRHRYSVQTAVSLFTAHRMRAFAGAGVSIKLQLRYLQYWHACLCDPALARMAIGRPARPRFRLHHIEIANATRWKRLHVAVSAYLRQADGVYIKPIYTGVASTVAGETVAYPLGEAAADAEDIQLVVNGVFYYWFNAVVERAGGEKCANEVVALAAERAQRARCVAAPPPFCHRAPWGDFDGFKGALPKGMRLFDSATVYWT